MSLKENEWFQYRIEEDHVVIEAYKKDDSVVEFPSQIENLPVTELESYVLSGKNCEEVCIPEGIRKIGRYGFYNCRKLKKLIFSSDFTDIGSGAFTGCHRIRKLEVWMKEEKTALREILTEVPEEVCVTLIWKGKDEIEKQKKAVLWFPEFFEESIENTPARILSVQTHGSGMFYRNCFQGKIFQFAEYDKRFETACAWESESFLMELVTARLQYPLGLGVNAQKRYEDFLNEHKTEILKCWVKEKREEALEWILRRYPHTKEQHTQYQEIMDYAAKEGTPAIVSQLMDYGRKIFPVKRKSFDL